MIDSRGPLAQWTESPDPEEPDVVVIGGGAAGVFGAIVCAEANPKLQIQVLERAGELLGKVRISGGGRCNVTHACFNPAELVERYPRGQRELRGPFHAWQPADTVRWFEEHGAALKVEPDGRMFPVSDSSQTIIHCLLQTARDLGVTFRTRTAVMDASRDGDCFRLRLQDGSELRSRRLLIAVGGLRPGPLLESIKRFGHSIEPLAPSLFTFHVKDSRIDGLQGVAVELAEVSIPGVGEPRRGPVLVTHWGLSGPAILQLSAWSARWAQERNYHFPCIVNWVPDRSAADVRKGLEQCRTGHARRCVRKTAAFDLPIRLWERLVAAAGIVDELQWSQLPREQTETLVGQLMRCEFQVTGKSMFKEEFVTCGGVSLREVQFKTMESRLVPGLHFAGEVLDIDGVTGGFNFQAAWTTGMLAGRAMAAGPAGGR